MFPSSVGLIFEADCIAMLSTSPFSEVGNRKRTQGNSSSFSKIKRNAVDIFILQTSDKTIGK